MHSRTSTVNATCGKLPCVAWAYCSKAPAAPMPAQSFGTETAKLRP